jgi:apolipoprotein N-acyltransferase
MLKIARPLVIGITLLIAIWTAYDMYMRTEQQLLWGHRPLLLFGALLILFHGIFSPSGRKPSLPLRLSTLSGLMLGLGFPGILPFPLWLFAGFVPLLILEEHISQGDLPGKGRQVFRYSYQAFLVWNILSTFWVANTALAAGVVAIMLNSLFMALVFTAFHHTRRIMPRIGLLAFVVYWISFEYLHLNWEISWPWLTLGHGFSQFPQLVQWYEYTGVFGGTAWVLLGNVLLYTLWCKRSTPLLPAIRFALWLLLPAAFSAWIFANYEEDTSNMARVAIVQPNYEPHYEKFDIPETDQMDRFLTLSGDVLDSTVNYLLWPETSFGYVETRAIEGYPAVMRLREFMADYPSLKVITGLDAYHIFLPGEEHSRAVRRTDRGNGQVMYFEVLNAAAQFSGESPETPIYRKSKLVPGPEILPYREIFGVFKPIIEQVQGTVSGVGTQAQRSTFNSSSGRIAPVICYESVFGEYFTGYIRNGAQTAFIMTNDGWWDNTAGHRQHLWIGRLRAIETRRSIARAANTGISAFINQRGEVLQASGYGEAAVIKGDIALNDRLTFYVRWGDIIARIAVFTSLILLLNSLSRRLQRK